MHALAVYQLVHQYIPSLRTATGAADLHGAHLSEGVVHTALLRAAAQLVPFSERVMALLQLADLAHSVTDAWSSYLGYGRVGALCNTHILRDLDSVHHGDPTGQQWAKAAIDALTAGNEAAHTARETGRNALTSEEIASLEAQFDRAVRVGRSMNPDPPPKTKKTFVRQLVDRLHRRREDTLRFLHDLTVPFTNNQAEQDIRMAKIQMKVSGGWRTLEGANRWLFVRSYLSTARKHGQNPMTVLRGLFAGNVWLPPAHA